MDIGLSVAICGALFTGVAIIYIFKPRGMNKETQREFDKVWDAINIEKKKVDNMNDVMIKIKEQYNYIIKAIDKIEKYIKNGQK